MKYDFDVLIIGAGAAGISAAQAASSAGAKVCMIEKAEMGGECPNWACVPSKAMLTSAKMYHMAKHHLEDFGLHADGVTFSFSRIMLRKDNIVSAITGKGKRIGKMMTGSGVKVEHGAAEFVDSHTIMVGKKKISAKSIIIATGSTNFVPPIDGIDKVGLGFREVVSLRRQPGSVAIVGAGPVGCEFATFFAMLGTKVTLLQLDKQILNREDLEIAAIVEKKLSDYGANILTDTKTLGVARQGRKKRVTYQTGRMKRQSVLVDQVIVAAGKRASLDGIKIEKSGVKVDAKGRLKLNDKLQTNVGHIFAAGDVTGGMMFTHIAHEEGEVAGHNAVCSRPGSMRRRDLRVVPRVTFTHPEVASVGVTQAEAAIMKMKFEVISFPVGSLARAITDGSREGMIKLVVDKKSRKILGAHMAGNHAGDVIHEAALAMHANLTVDDIAATIHAFPTYSEALAAAASML
ncbi:MAG: NAD(P)/FAD-dependent oxidoreductase [bacterium]